MNRIRLVRAPVEPRTLLVVVALHVAIAGGLLGVREGGARVGVGVVERFQPLDQRFGLIAHPLVEVHQPRIRVVDRRVSRFEVKEHRTAADKRLVVTAVRRGEPGVQLVEELPLPAGPLQNRLGHRMSGLARRGL